MDKKIDELGSEIFTECNLISKNDFGLQYKVKFVYYISDFSSRKKWENFR